MPNDSNEPRFNYRPEDEPSVSGQIGPENDSQKGENNREISWIGSEFITKHKDANWYFAYFLGLVVVLIAVFFITRQDIVSTVVVAVAGTLFGYLAGHKPRQLKYTLNEQGISVGGKFYPFEQFKSFELAEDGAIVYVNLLPLKMFLPELSIYFPPQQAQAILEILRDHLPFEEKSERTVDKLTKKLRF